MIGNSPNPLNEELNYKYFIMLSLNDFKSKKIQNDKDVQGGYIWDVKNGPWHDIFTSGEKITTYLDGMNIGTDRDGW